MTVLYANMAGNAISAEEKTRYINITEQYLIDSQLIDLSTGEARQFYPDFTRDQRRKRQKLKLENSNSYASRLQGSLGDDLWFYTLNLSDVYPIWGAYSSVFNHERMEKIKAWVKRRMIGAFSGRFEISPYVGMHIHFVAGRQVSPGASKVLKAELKVDDYSGLVGYLNKPLINPKYKGTDEYNMIVGIQLEAKAKMKEKNKILNLNERLPRQSVYRLS